MSSFLDVLVAIAALGLVIVIHEFGHYITAVATGMKVDRFSVFGIGPAILKLGRWRGTEFVVGAIPFGAYVLIRGMEAPPETETRAVAPASSSNFRDKPLASRALVLAGGPLANYLAAILLYFGLFATVGVRGPVVAIEVDRVQASVAEQLDLQVGDELVAVANVPIDLSRDGRDVLELAEANRGETVALEIRRDGVQRTVSVPIPADSDESLPFAPGRRYDGWVPVGLGEAARLSVEKPWAITVLQLEGLGRLLRFDTQNAKPTGPVGIVREIANQASEGLIPLLLTTAFISTLLGLFNLLPIPALDGGRLVFLAWEGVTRRRANPNIEEAVHAYGLLALLALILVVTFFDVNRLVS